MNPPSTSSSVQVPLLDLVAQYAALREEILPAITAVLDSQHCVNGPAVGELESALADYCGSKFAIGVSSGTDALIAALMALDIRPGDEVITTPYTFFATAGSIWRAGATPVFVDIEPDTFNIDPSRIEPAITERTRAIMPVHLFGQMADMTAITDIAQRRGLHIIEDAAQAIGATQHGRKAGSLSAIGCFSFYPTKNLGAAGDAGLCTTDDPALYHRLLTLRNHGAQQRYFHEEVGGNFRLDTLQAAYLLKKLPHLEAWHQQRRDNAALYDELFADVDEVITPAVAPGNVSIFNQYVVRVPAACRDALQKHLTSCNVGTAIYYPLSLHEQQCFASLGGKHGDFPESERAAAESLALPIYPELTETQVRHVVASMQAFFAAP